MTNNTMMKMTNKDAIECIKANICYKQSCCNDGICKSTDDRICAIDMAIEALKKQEPKKLTTRDYEEGRTFICPCCGVEYNRFYIGMPFCMYCSQALDWSDEE